MVGAEPQAFFLGFLQTIYKFRVYVECLLISLHFMDFRDKHLMNLLSSELIMLIRVFYSSLANTTALKNNWLQNFRPASADKNKAS